jgi:anti-sigma regulatory factor (Ser/Thr protein kinase)
MRVHIPNSAYLGNIDPFLSSMNLEENDRLIISGNERWISVHPAILTMIAALSSTIEKTDVIVEDFEPRSLHYLNRMGLFEYLGVLLRSEIIEHDPSGRFIPISRIRNSDELSRFITEMIPLLHLESEFSEPIRFIISELVRNVIEHSRSETGAFVAAQLYKKSNRIGIGIADRGCGIRESISKSHFTRSDMDAIRLSMMPGITGETRREGGTEMNAGAGLFFIRSLALSSRDFFLLYSGDSMYKLLKRDLRKKTLTFNADPFKDRNSRKDGLPFWKGTVVGFDISLDRTREFRNALKLIGSTYVNAVKERKKKKYRRPKFI